MWQYVFYVMLAVMSLAVGAGIPWSLSDRRKNMEESRRRRIDRRISIVMLLLSILFFASFYMAIREKLALLDAM